MGEVEGRTFFARSANKSSFAVMASVVVRNVGWK